MLAVFVYELVQRDSSLGRGDAAQEGEHDGFVHVQEGIRLAQVALHQDVYLRPEQVVDDGKVDVVAEEALPHALAEEVDGILRGAVVAVAQELVGAGILLDVLEEAAAGSVEALNAALVLLQQDFQHVARFGKLLHIGELLLHLPADALDEQCFLVRKHLVERALGDAERGGDVVHRDALDAMLGKEVAGGFDDSLFQFPAGGGLSGWFVHSPVLVNLNAKLGKKTQLASRVSTFLLG